MKQHLSSVTRAFFAGFGAAALGSAAMALMLMLYDIPRTVHIAVLPWAALLLGVALVCEALYARGTNLLVYVAACAALLYFGGERVVSATVFDPASHGFPIFLRLLTWGSGVFCAYCVHKQPVSDLFVRFGDMLIIALGLYLAGCRFLGDALIPSFLAFACAALIACLFSAASLRAGGESNRVVRGTSMGGMLLLLMLPAACVVLAGALLSIAGGHVNGVVAVLMAIWRVLTAVAKHAMMLLARLIALIAPKPVQYNMAMQQEDSFVMQSAGIEVTAKMPQWIIYLIIALLILLGLAVVIAILWALRKTKLTRAKKRKPRRVTRTSRMLPALLARLRALRDALSFEIAYRRHRRTIEGLYVLAVRRCQLTRLKKRPGESPAAFIRRLHAHLLRHSGLSTLDALADKLERTLYAGERVPLSHGESDAFAAQIAALAHFSGAKDPASR